ncbi:MAG: hypothetical protein GY757_53460, partial [bacterium]|nr:hypothetical protein [bacterium]
SGLYPELEFGGGYGNRGFSYMNSEGGIGSSNWRETTAFCGIRVPLNLSRGIYFTGINIGTHLSYIHITLPDEFVMGTTDDGFLKAVTYRFHFSRMRNRAYRELKPMWGQYFTLAYRHTPFRRGFDGSLLSIRGGLYLPGLFRNNSFLVKGGYERLGVGGYRFPGETAFPRGYDYIAHDRVYSFSGTYAFPLVYPDYALGSIFYLKRIRGEVFFDYTVGEDSFSGGWEQREHYGSVGVELLTDFHLFNIDETLTLGGRVSYRFKDNSFRFEPFVLHFYF